MRRLARWIRLHARLTVALSAAVALILLNLVAYLHAHAMLNFTERGARTARPEQLSIVRKAKTLLTGVNIPRPQNSSTPSDYGLEFETHRVVVSDTISLEAWYVPRAESRGVVLMFHGYAASKSSLLPEAGALHKMGYAAFLVDLRGSGGSSGSRTSVGYHEADDVAKSVEHVRSVSAARPLVLFGRSMGGAAVLRAIHVNGVRPDAIVVEAVFDRMLSTVKARFSAMGLPPFPFAQLLAFWGGVQAGYSGFGHNPAAYAASVQCPALMLHGTQDGRATIDQARAVFRSLRGEKQLVVFEGLEHEPYLTAEPRKWRRAVSQFLLRSVATNE